MRAQRRRERNETNYVKCADCCMRYSLNRAPVCTSNRIQLQANNASRKAILAAGKLTCERGRIAKVSLLLYADLVHRPRVKVRCQRIRSRFVVRLELNGAAHAIWLRATFRYDFFAFYEVVALLPI